MSALLIGLILVCGVWAVAYRACDFPRNFQAACARVNSFVNRPINLEGHT